MGGVLVVGSGGREHALVWKLAQSPGASPLYAAPGNPGIAALAECLPLQVGDLEGITAAALRLGVELVVVGPEAPLAAGLADRLRAAGVAVFGPSRAAARIESSKAFARALMARAGVPQPAHSSWDDPAAALGEVDRLAAAGVERLVVKASGLAAGKGAVVCDDLDQAREAVREIMLGGAFGEAGRQVVLEERLEGEEVSFFVLCDGRNALPLLAAQDYKRLEDGDRGPNTGGMGAYCPAPRFSPGLQVEVLARVVRPVLDALAGEGCPFQGCLYAGLMLTPDGVKVIEFNCRFGDPETQALLPLMDSDFHDLLTAAASGGLEGVRAEWRPGAAVCVVLAAEGYPGDPRKGVPLTGLEEAAALEGVTLFHAGTALRDGAVVTAGGRVLNVVGTGPDFAAARARAYAGLERIHLEGGQYRRDIGARVAGCG